MLFDRLLHWQPGRSARCGRRQFLEAGVLGLAGSSFLSQISLHADQLRKDGRACILVWLAGAPSQFETWDPKPGTENGGSTKAINTSAPGVRIAEHWPKLAQVMQDVAVIRTIVGKEAAHERGTYHLHTGRRLGGPEKFPNFGSLVAHKIGDPDADLPNFVSVGNTLSSGFLGVKVAPFVVNRPGQLPDNAAAGVGTEQTDRRLALLNEQDKEFAQFGAEALVHEHQERYKKAQRLMRSPRLKAFQLTEEPEPMQAAYGKAGFGQGMLVARRLVEAGVPFVEVQRGGWDMHEDIFNRIKPAATEVDTALSELLKDLKQRGLLARTTVICMGEFGRTPKINDKKPGPGRDHWARNFNVLLAGGGIRGGKVIGKTSDNGQEILDRPVAVEDLFQTLCRVMGIDAGEELYTPAGRPLKIVDGGEVIKELFA